MTRQEINSLWEAATRERQRHELRTALWGLGALVIFVPVIHIFGNHLIEHPDALLEFVQSGRGLRWFLAMSGVGALLLAFLGSRVKPSCRGVPCPNCRQPLYGCGVKLALISGNCSRCGCRILDEPAKNFEDPK